MELPIAPEAAPLTAPAAAPFPDTGTEARFRAGTAVAPEAGQPAPETRIDPADRPPSSPDDIRLSFPEGVDVDQNINLDFRELCVQNGISPRQAQALADWQMRLDREYAARQKAAVDDALRRRWGAETEANRMAALDVAQHLDRKLGGDRLSSLLNGPLGSNPVLYETLHLISTMISEESLGSTSPDAPVERETPLDAYKALFRE